MSNSTSSSQNLPLQQTFPFSLRLKANFQPLSLLNVSSTHLPKFQSSTQTFGHYNQASSASSGNLRSTSSRQEGTSSSSWSSGLRQHQQRPLRQRRAVNHFRRTGDRCHITKFPWSKFVDAAKVIAARGARLAAAAATLSPVASASQVARVCGGSLVIMAGSLGGRPKLGESSRKNV